jgi:hypothetical protein
MSIGLAFALFYTIMGIPIARIADRVSRGSLLVVALAVFVKILIKEPRRGAMELSESSSLSKGEIVVRVKCEKIQDRSSK